MAATERFFCVLLPDSGITLSGKGDTEIMVPNKKRGIVITVSCRGGIEVQPRVAEIARGLAEKVPNKKAA